MMVTLTDMFCGAGGSTTGATQAGASVKLAINHWKVAVETHNSNYPDTLHVLTDLHKANPRRFPRTDGLLASPECTAHSISKGRKRKESETGGLWDDGEPDLETQAEERSRCTMWTPLDWAECHNYQFVILENVVDATLWRPFHAWLAAWKSLGYEYELVSFNSMFAHPTPQSRNRLYFVAWKQGMRRPNLKICPQAYCSHCQKDVASVQSWRNPTKRYGKYRQQYDYRCPFCAQTATPYFYCAANAIDWTIPAPRIADRKISLREKTMQRIAYGLHKFSQQNEPQVGKAPFILNLSHTAIAEGYVYSTEQHPLPTQTTRDDVGLVAPPFLLDHLGEYRPRPILGPCSTICAAGNHQSVILPPSTSSWIMSYYNHGTVVSTQEAVPTVTTLERHALITGEVLPPTVEACGFRMLLPREIRAAMAFPENYILTGTRREQVKQLGNACTPPVIKMLVERVLASLSHEEGAA